MLDTLFGLESIPEIKWGHGDDLCDCTFQRIGWWTNPYLGKTLEIRLCCAWRALAARFPEVAECMREIPAFNDPEGNWQTGPAEWDADYDMPRYLWYRHLAAKTGKPLEEIRREYDHLNAPKAVKKPDECECRGPAENNRRAGGADTGVAGRGPARGRRGVPLASG